MQLVLIRLRIDSRSQKTLCFQSMKEVYDYVFAFASGITIISRFRLQILCLITFTSRLRLYFFCLITITKLLDYDYNIITLNSLFACCFLFFFKCIVYLSIYDIYVSYLFMKKISVQYL